MSFKNLFQTALTDTWTTASDGDPVGDLRWEGGVLYKCVLYDDGTADLDVAAGDVVGYVAVTGYLASTVTADVSDTDDVGAGIVVAAVTVTSTYMWVQLTGTVTLNTTLTAGTTQGYALTLKGANDKTLDVSGAVTDVICAWTLVDATDVIACNFPH